MNRYLFLLSFIVSINLLHANSEFVPIQSRAQGQSLTGSSQLNDSLYTNPAASAFTQVYSIDGSFLTPKSFAVSILDTKTSDIGGSLGYFRQALPTSSEPLQGAKVALLGRGHENVAIGLGGKMLWGTLGRLTDLDAGVLTNFSFYQFGMAVQNLFGGNSKLDQSRELSLGGRIGYQNTLYFSAATQSKFENLKPYQYGFGAEYISPYYFSLKGGYRIRTDNSESFWSGGVSFLSPRMSIHYALEFPRQGSNVEHALGTTLLF